MHGFVGANSTNVASNPVVVVVTSNFTIVASDFAKIQVQQMVVIQVKANNLETT
jgi:hypothetical protein